jgi:tRNA-dihydrouridine synthase
MVGRGAQGRPWVLAQIAADIYGTPKPDIPKGHKLVDMISAHYEAMLDFYGSDLGNRVARKHLGWCMDEAGTVPALRKSILTANNPQDVLSALPNALLTDVRQAA